MTPSRPRDTVSRDEGVDGLTAARFALSTLQPSLESSYRAILTSRLGQKLTPGTQETPARAAKAWRELTEGYDVDVKALFKTFDDDGYAGMVMARRIPFASLCEHHLLPFVGTADIVYLPSHDRVVGYSKMARLVDAYARRLQQQERLTKQIADAMVEGLDPVGVLVHIEAVHSCASLRGPRKHGMDMVTADARGAMLDKAETRAEAYALLRR